MLCFCPRNTSPDNPRFFIPKIGSVPFKHNRVFIRFPQRDWPLHIKGNPKLFWLFTFQVEPSLINLILKINGNNWFQDITITSIQKSRTMNINFNPEMIKPRRRKLYQDCDTITLGYIDLIPPKKRMAMNGLVYMMHS